MRSLALLAATVLAALVLAGAAGAVPPEQYDPAAPTADLGLHLDSGTVQATSDGRIVSPATYTFTVYNDGPGTATATEFAFHGSGDVHPIEYARPSQGTCQVNGRYADCRLGDIAPGARATVVVRSHPQTWEGSVGEGRVKSAKSDPAPWTNHQGKRPATVPAGSDPGPGPGDGGDPPPGLDVAMPDTTIGAPASRVRRKTFRVFRGTARDKGSGVSKVQIAVLRVERRASCRWLSSPRARFKDGGCSTRRWLPARGRSKWTYKLKRALPKGRYRVFARAIDRTGNVESGWSAADRNVRSFTVR